LINLPQRFRLLPDHFSPGYCYIDIVIRICARQVSAWVTHIIVNQSSHDERKAVLSCILRLLQTCWNIGNFNAVAEIINGLKSVFIDCALATFYFLARSRLCVAAKDFLSVVDSFE